MTEKRKAKRKAARGRPQATREEREPRVAINRWPVRVPKSLGETAEASRVSEPESEVRRMEQPLRKRKHMRMAGQEEGQKKKEEDGSAMDAVNTSGERDGGKESVENSRNETLDDSSRLDETNTGADGAEDDDAEANQEDGEEHEGHSGEGGAGEDEEEEYAFEDENENEDDDKDDSFHFVQPKTSVRCTTHHAHARVFTPFHPHLDPPHLLISIFLINKLDMK
jgi:hypothetical protein